MKVVMAASASRDLAAIADWLDQESPRAADRVIARLEKATRALGRFPMRFAIDERTGLRRRPLSPYLIFYRVTDHVEIIRVLHGARDWQALLEG